MEEAGISFNNRSENYCISIVDIVDSTSIVSCIQSSDKIRMFYSIFINVLASTLKKYNGRIIKTVGDGIISYFPTTKEMTNIGAFENVIECLLSQVENQDEINSRLDRQKLPGISYRISADYGRVEIAKSAASHIEDLFGSTVNYCSKINSQASPNGVIIGNDLYRIIKSFSKLKESYHIVEHASYNLGVGKYTYPIYSLSRRPMNLKAAIPSKYINPESTVQKIQAPDTLSPKANILLIDDERDDLYVLEKFLTMEGFGVKAFSSSDEALDHFAQTNPASYDLVVSDIRMPEINGFELYLKLKAIKSDVKMIFATCLEIADEIFSLAPGVKQVEVIKKPIEQQAFIEIVKRNIRAG
jgi:class 3 adenylate cyclase